MRVDIWSDYICPWCYLGTELAEWLEQSKGCQVVWHAFELHPEIPVGRRALIKRNGRGHMAELMREAGLPYKAPTRAANSHAALEVGELARAQNVFPEWHRRAFRAHFVHDLDISDEEVLRGVGEEAGLDPDDVSDVLCRGLYAETVDRSREKAMDHGVSGAPAFLFDRRFVVPGVQRRDLFVRIIEKLSAMQ